MAVTTTPIIVGDKVRLDGGSKVAPWIGTVSDVKPNMPYPYYVEWAATDVINAFTGVHSRTELRKRKGLGD